MSALLLRQHIERHVPLSGHDWQQIEAACIPRRFRRHQYLIQEGGPARYDIFVTSGCLRAYKVDERGQEHVLQFAIEGWWTGDLYAFLTGTPATVNIDCLEESEVLLLDREALETLYISVPQLERYFRILMQNAYVAFQRRTNDFQQKSAAERYQDFVSRYPAIEQRVSNRQIASYLGITPESLSRLRIKAASR